MFCLRLQGLPSHHFNVEVTQRASHMDCFWNFECLFEGLFYCMSMHQVPILMSLSKMFGSCRHSSFSLINLFVLL